MRRSWLERRGIEVVAAALVAGGVAIACGGDNPVEPVRPECRRPTTSDFRDSAQARVVIGDFGFHPEAVTIRAGQTVRWIHCGPETDEHTVTSSGTGPLDSPYLGLDEEFSFTFSNNGSYPYVCTPHATFMTGTVTVQP